MQKNKPDYNSYQLLFEIGKRLLAEADINQVLTVAMDHVIELSGAERGMIILFQDSEEILFETARNLKKQDIENPEFEISKTIINKVRKEKTAVFYPNALEVNELKESKSAFRLRILSVICLPLIYDQKIFGLVYLDNRKVKKIFRPEVFEFVQRFTEFVSFTAFRALERKNILTHLKELENELREKYKFESIIGHDPQMVDVLDLVAKIANTNATVLIQGESGTGKELIARAIHFNSLRQNESFIPVNCAALPENLLESELFGHVRGSFTGAVKDHKGWFECAEGGSIFLDEISEMSPALQAKLLRVLQSGEFSRLGSSEIKQVDVRIITASSKHIKNMVTHGQFREDLFYRLNVIPISLPPLRKRKYDVLLLAEHFLSTYKEKYRKKDIIFSDAALHYLKNYAFPGNVRELENMIQRGVILAKENKVTRELLLDTISEKGDAEAEHKDFKAAKEILIEGFEKDYLSNCLKKTKGNITKAAELANLHVTNFHAKLRKYGIEHENYD